MNKTGKALGRFLLRQLYPDRCPVCDQVLQHDRICPECRKKLIPIHQPSCMRCGCQLADLQQEYCADCSKNAHAFIQGRGIWTYQGEMRRILYRYKYGNRRDYTEFFAREALRCCQDWIRRIGIEVIVPVPLHRRKKRKRGYNQAELFASRLSELSGIPMEADLLVRTRDTVPQKELSRGERKINLKKAFKISKNVIQCKKVLLIDDIYTTGSTIDAAAEALHTAKIGEVYFLCISIGKGL